MNEPVYVTTPVGRLVMGDAFNGSDKDGQGRPRLDQKGQPKTQWFIGLAIAKNDPGWADLWNQICGVAQRDFPGGEWQRPGFAWKVADGDGTNNEGKPYPDYCKGHYIVKMSTGFAPTVHNVHNQQITDPAQCKRGDYVRAYLSMKGNGDRQKPGVYLSHSMIQVCGYGEAISTGPTAEQAFGAPPAQLPPGASATPVAPAGPMPAQPGAPVAAALAPAPYAAPPAAPAPTAPAPAAPAPTAGYAPAPAPTAPQAPTASPSSAPVAPYPQIMNGPAPAPAAHNPSPPVAGPTQ